MIPNALLLRSSVLCATLLLSFALVSGLAFKSCTEKQTADVSTGLSVTANAVSAGYDTVHSLRLAGEVKPDVALTLAKDALDVNSAEREIVGGMLDLKELDSAGQAKFSDQLDKLIPRVNTLVSDGTLHIKNGKVQVFIAITSAGADVGLRQLQSQLKSGALKGLTIPISDDTKAQLQVTASVIDANDRKLRASIAELGGSN